MKKITILKSLSILICCMLSAEASIWQALDDKSIVYAQNSVTTKHYSANLFELKQALITSGSALQKSDRVIDLPSGNGKVEAFYIEESAIMSPELAAKYPEIKSYKLYGKDDPYATGRISISADSVSGLITTRTGRYFLNQDVQSSTPDGSNTYSIAKFKGTMDDVIESCNVREHPDHNSIEQDSRANKSSSALPEDRQEYSRRREHTGKIFRYRLAIATSYEFTQSSGGTKATALAAVVSVINRVNEIYERELGVSFELIPETEQFLFTTANDPYSGSNDDRVDQNTAVMNPIREKIDIGHLFANGGGGTANLSSLCPVRFDQKKNDDGSYYYDEIYKAGAGSFVHNHGQNDSFTLLVAHEMGHQLGAIHTYGGQTSSCNNRSSNYFEPGSGSSIMGYNGSCGSENLPGGDQPMFHAASFDSIKWGIYLTEFRHATCLYTEVDIGNDYYPVIDAGSDHTIPISTPFELEAVASDEDGDALSYTWDEWNDHLEKNDRIANRTTSSTLGQDLTYNPLMRSFMPSASPKRYFPQPKVLFGDATSQEIKSETLPTTNRTMKYTATARDGKGEREYDSLILTATTSAGPFKVTSQSTAQTLNAGSNVTLNWNVAGTASGVVNCPKVDIEMLMYDSGNKLCERSLLSSVANDGSQRVSLPDVNTARARFKVSCSNNVFFALSAANIKIKNASTTLDCSSASVIQNVNLTPIIMQLLN